MRKAEQDSMTDKKIPVVTSDLRSHMIEVPEVIHRVTGIRILGKRIKSIVFSTDVAIICNINADAVMAVYPFTPQPPITHAIMSAAAMPVFCGVGGGLTRGERVRELARDAESQGALGVVVNAPTPNDTIVMMNEVIDIPIIVTVVSEKTDIDARLNAGVDIINVSGAARTPEMVYDIRKRYPDIPIIATGGPNETSIYDTIEAGANAITYTPPPIGELFKPTMAKYRKAESGDEQ